jgi:hypothetical protein
VADAALGPVPDNVQRLVCRQRLAHGILDILSITRSQ